MKSGNREIELNPIGNTFGNSCRTLELSGAIDGIRVAESSSLNYITGIQYLKDNPTYFAKEWLELVRS